MPSSRTPSPFTLTSPGDLLSSSYGLFPKKKLNKLLLMCLSLRNKAWSDPQRSTEEPEQPYLSRAFTDYEFRIIFWVKDPSTRQGRSSAQPTGVQKSFYPSVVRQLKDDDGSQLTRSSRSSPKPDDFQPNLPPILLYTTSAHTLRTASGSTPCPLLVLLPSPTHTAQFFLVFGGRLAQVSSSTFWLVAFSPGGIIPLPFPICLGFPDGLVLACYLLARGKHWKAPASISRPQSNFYRKRAKRVDQLSSCYSILFYSNLFYSILFYSILFYSILFYSILFYYILFYYILFYSTIVPYYFSNLSSR